MVARAAYCVAVVADPGPAANQPTAAAANGGSKTKTDPSTGGHDGTSGGGGVEQDPRTALAAVGLVPPLVRGLRHNNTDVVARSVAALEVRCVCVCVCV